MSAHDISESAPSGVSLAQRNIQSLFFPHDLQIYSKKYFTQTEYVNSMSCTDNKLQIFTLTLDWVQFLYSQVTKTINKLLHSQLWHMIRSWLSLSYYNLIVCLYFTISSTIRGRIVFKCGLRTCLYMGSVLKRLFLLTFPMISKHWPFGCFTWLDLLTFVLAKSKPKHRV